MCECVCVIACLCLRARFSPLTYLYTQLTSEHLSFMFSTDLVAFHGDPVPCVRRTFLHCCCPDLSHCRHLGEMTSLAHSRRRRSTPHGWPDSRTWHRIRSQTDTRHSSPYRRRIWRRSSRNCCRRSCRRRRCSRDHSRRRPNMSRPRPHTASCLRSLLNREARLQRMEHYR